MSRCASRTETRPSALNERSSRRVSVNRRGSGTRAPRSNATAAAYNVATRADAAERRWLTVEIAASTAGNAVHKAATTNLDDGKSRSAYAPTNAHCVPKTPASVARSHDHFQLRSAHHHAHTINAGHVHQSRSSIEAVISSGTEIIAVHGCTARVSIRRCARVRARPMADIHRLVAMRSANRGSGGDFVAKSLMQLTCAVASCCVTSADSGGAPRSGRASIRRVDRRNRVTSRAICDDARIAIGHAELLRHLIQGQSLHVEQPQDPVIRRL